MYTNGLTIAVKTVDHGLRNPCNHYSVPNITQFVVYFYSWENLTSSSTRSIDYAYMTINTNNMNPFPLTYNLEPFSVTSHFTFDWIHTPHERFYN